MEEQISSDFIQEQRYFDRTMEEVNRQLQKELGAGKKTQADLIAARKEIWDNTAHCSDDFDRLTEFNQYLDPLLGQTSSYLSGASRIARLRQMLDSPYFARIDFTEKGSPEAENIYIGRSNLMDDDTYEIYVYDWRSPIASVFYRYELGEVSYQAPKGTIHGSVSRKRQYEIKEGKLSYFFEADVQVADEFLRSMLSKNASEKMKSIVETIQRDQDFIIRDTENDLLMVQGAAGSGKTSVALHRAAYLMYQGLASKLSANNILILSPNQLFGEYIGEVLPGLGENSVQTKTFEEISAQVLGGHSWEVQTRNQFYELLMSGMSGQSLLRSGQAFKFSRAFLTLLDRLLLHYERHLIPFEDVYYDGRYLVDRHALKERFLRLDQRTSLSVRLRQLEERILEQVREQRKERLPKLEAFVGSHPEHAYEVKQIARLYSMRESRLLLARIKRFTEVDLLALYRRLFHDKALFYQMAKGLSLPENIEEIRATTDQRLGRRTLAYEDLIPLTYLGVKVSGCQDFREIRQVVLDEAQDYYPMHFALLNALFPAAKYTILGDFNQTIDKCETLELYESVKSILQKKKSALLTMNKSFRCTREITAFCERFLEGASPVESYGRSGREPELVGASTKSDFLRAITEAVFASKSEGYETIAILCKSSAEASILWEAVHVELPDAVRIDESSKVRAKGVLVLPIYLAKGLEFDSVLVAGADDRNFYTQEDKKLLYVASTRALHRLSFFYLGKQSRFFQQP